MAALVPWVRSIRTAVLSGRAGLFLPSEQGRSLPDKPRQGIPAGAFPICRTSDFFTQSVLDAAGRIVYAVAG